ncbi:sodium channel protein Nach-like [Battus philenor]|uniref:sodium channel protein Nach-like n=1 Tax=Battus philenor TaxID=42288 RepID=UPI0035CF2B08
MNLVELAQIHGLKYLMRSKHRCQWSLLLFTFMVCSVVMLWIWLDRYLENPTYIVLVESKKTKKPFPSVVVCPEIAFPVHRMEAFIQKLTLPQGFTEAYIRKVLNQLAAFFSPDVQYRLADLKNIERILDHNHVDVEEAGLNLTTSCDETISRDFENKPMQRKVDHSGFYGNFDIYSGLLLVINQSLTTPYDVDLSYKWLTLHSSQRYIDLPGNGTPITPGTEFFAEYSTTGLQVDDEAVDLDTDLRRCKMSYDGLKYFPYYHKKYCLVENEMRKTYELCGCMKVGHLRLPGVPVCRAKDLKCARRAAVSFGETNTECPVTCDVELDQTAVATYDLRQDLVSYDSF